MYKFYTLSFLFISFIPDFKVNGQTFLRSCNDQVIVDHQVRNGHSFCSHACGSLPQSNSAVCLGNGACSCPCAAGSPQLPFGSICPPSATDPPDPDPTALPRCQSMCAGACADGVGMICGEIAPQGPNGDIFAKICTCNCPPPCMSLTTTTTQKSIILLKNPLKPLLYLKKLHLFALWIIAKKVIMIGLSIFGVMAKLILFKIIVIMCMDVLISFIQDGAYWLDSMISKVVGNFLRNIFRKMTGFGFGV